MTTTTASRIRRTLLTTVAAASLSAGCADDAPLAPEQRVARLDGCENLQTPAGSRLAYHTYARGVQIYRWTGTSWAFVEPSAVLYSDAHGKSAVGSHYGGPTWLSATGSRVVAAVRERCNRDGAAIPWLLLGAVSADGGGEFQGTTFIQRVNTIGGNAPTAPGAAAGELASVPYSAEYFFYRTQ